MTNIGHSIDTRAVAPGRRRLLAFLGPAALVSVGYMDPGNWATDLQGGAAFGYQLVWVLLLSNFIAMLLQTLAARLGIAGGVDLAQACRAHYPRAAMLGLWVLCEIAIVACDLAEVLGSAVALNLLFGLPLLWGTLVTAFDVLLILLLQHRGVRTLEALITVMVLTIGACFALEIALARPDWPGVAAGLVPHVDAQSLYVAIGILGATVMPHNLYLHSSLVQTRRIGEGAHFVREALRYNLADTVLLLGIAFFINAAILILSAAVFHRAGIAVTDLRQAHALLAPILGTWLAPMAFAIALLVAGQSSTITGTLAGQIVMEGFLRIRLSPAKLRLLTRSFAIVPAVAVLVVSGEGGVLQLLVLSQVVLSLQLPFAMVPLIRFTGDRDIMGAFASPLWVKLLVWIAAVGIIALNTWLITQSVVEWTRDAAPGLAATVVIAAFASAPLLAWITFGRLRHPSTARIDP